MSAPQFTPGPWRAEEQPEADFEVFAGYPLNCIATVLYEDINGGNPVRANASLIVNAPELFEALRPFAEACEGCVGPEDIESQSSWEHPVAMNVSLRDFIKARNVLARARGDQ